MRRQRDLTPDEQKLWREATRDVRQPDRGRATLRHANAADRPVVSTVTPSPVEPAMTDPTPIRRVPVATRRATLVPGRLETLDAALQRRLRRGLIPIDSRLDLHGMTQAQAYSAVRDCIQRAASLGFRCVLVITGRGSGPEDADRHGDGGRGVLRRSLPGWLNQPELQQHVLALVHAQPRHGGSGAFYVLFKRKTQ